jgi:hypothetical protein
MAAAASRVVVVSARVTSLSVHRDRPPGHGYRHSSRAPTAWAGETAQLRELPYPVQCEDCAFRCCAHRRQASSSRCRWSPSNSAYSSTPVPSMLRVTLLACRTSRLLYEPDCRPDRAQAAAGSKAGNQAPACCRDAAKISQTAFVSFMNAVLWAWLLAVWRLMDLNCPSSPLSGRDETP